MVPTIGEVVAFALVNAEILPAPLAARPMAVLELVHANVAPAGLLVNVTAGTATPGHIVSLAGNVTVGKGLTVMV